MLEYVPRVRFAEALRDLRDRLKPGGHFILFMTRRNPFTRVLIGRWWQSNLYASAEIASALRGAGFASIAFRRFPHPFGYLGLWGHAIEARR